MRYIDLTAATRDLMAAPCRACTWWQQRLPATVITGGQAAGAGPPAGEPAPPPSRLAWERDIEAACGFFGSALVEGEAVIGWMHVAPADLVPRARFLPTGPPGADAHLLTCAYFYDDEYLEGFHQLLRETEYALKGGAIRALEAYAARHSSEDDRFRGYLRELNLFNPQVLEGSGFRPVARVGGVVRYRLDLVTLISVPRRSSLWEHVKPHPATQPV